MGIKKSFKVLIDARPEDVAKAIGNIERFISLLPIIKSVSRRDEDFIVEFRDIENLERATVKVLRNSTNDGEILTLNFISDVKVTISFLIKPAKGGGSVIECSIAADEKLQSSKTELLVNKLYNALEDVMSSREYLTTSTVGSDTSEFGQGMTEILGSIGRLSLRDYAIKVLEKPDTLGSEVVLSRVILSSQLIEVTTLDVPMDRVLRFVDYIALRNKGNTLYINIRNDAIIRFLIDRDLTVVGVRIDLSNGRTLNGFEALSFLMTHSELIKGKAYIFRVSSTDLLG